MTVLDVGANVGYYTVLAAKGVGPQRLVVSFEPVAEPGDTRGFRRFGCPSAGQTGRRRLSDVRDPIETAGAHSAGGRGRSPERDDAGVVADHLATAPGLELDRLAPVHGCRWATPGMTRGSSATQKGLQSQADGGHGDVHDHHVAQGRRRG